MLALAGDATAAGVAPAAASPAASAAGAASAAPVALAPPSYVYIKRHVEGEGGAAADGEVYAALAALPGDTVGLLAARACAAFGWGAPSQVALILLASKAGDEAPTA
jgi:hypothetical protein